MKMRKRYRPLLLTLLLCLSLTACGSPDGDIAGGDWRTTGAVDAYGTVARDGGGDRCVRLPRPQSAVFLLQQ